MFFGDGRKPLLDFLRNLGPQFVALAFAIICASKLDLNKFDLSYEGFRRTLPFLLCMLVYLASLLANSTTFFEESLKAYRGDQIPGPVGVEQLRGWRKLRANLAYGWSTSKGVFLKMLVVMLVIEGATVVAILQAVGSAASSPFLQ